LKKAVVVGSGAAGATVARELQENFDVTETKKWYW